jgi:hypothetical protein
VVARRDISPTGDEPDPTRADLARLVWVLGLVWLALGAFVIIAQRFLGWRLAAGLIGAAGALFTFGIGAVVAGDLLAGSVWRWWQGRRPR